MSSELDRYAYELHRQRQKRPPRWLKVYSKGIDDIWGIDTVFMDSKANPWAGENNGFKYIMMVIDVASRYAWAYPLKTTKSAESVLALENIMDESGRRPKRVWLDQGTEYKKDFLTALDKWGIKSYHSYGTHKVSLVERLNRTIKNQLFRAFTEQQNHRWIDVLPKIMRKYNSSKHRTLGMTPFEASRATNSATVSQHNTALPADFAIEKPKYKVGQWVRLNRVKGTFERGFDASWTAEVYKIIKVLTNEGIPTYQIADYLGEPILGQFYQNELQPTNLQNFALVEKVITTDKRRSAPYYVKFLGWPARFNRWLTEDELGALREEAE